MYTCIFVGTLVSNVRKNAYKFYDLVYLIGQDVNPTINPSKSSIIPSAKFSLFNNYRYGDYR